MRKRPAARSLPPAAGLSFAATVRAIAVALAIAMVGTGVWVILNDRPGGRVGPGDMAGLTERCSGSARLGLSRYHAQFDLTPGGYWMYGYVTATRRLAAGGGCQLAAPVPGDATHVREFGFRTHSVHVPVRVESAVASVSRAGRLALPVQLGLEYFSPGIWRQGWGEVGLVIPIAGPVHGAQPGELISERGGTSTGTAILPLREDVAVLCPPGSRTVSAYPAGAQQTDPGAVVWTSLPQNAFAEVTCQNPQVRFWVDHATDLIVLGLGAILGILMALNPKRRRATRDSPPQAVSFPVAGPDLRPFRRMLMLGLIVLALATRQRRRILRPVSPDGNSISQELRSARQNAT
jgi:hypothetical protein